MTQLAGTAQPPATGTPLLEARALTKHFPVHGAGLGLGQFLGHRAGAVLEPAGGQAAAGYPAGGGGGLLQRR